MPIFFNSLVISFFFVLSFPYLLLPFFIKEVNGITFWGIGVLSIVSAFYLLYSRVARYYACSVWNKSDEHNYDFEKDKELRKNYRAFARILYFPRMYYIYCVPFGFFLSYMSIIPAAVRVFNIPENEKGRITPVGELMKLGGGIVGVVALLGLLMLIIVYFF